MKTWDFKEQIAIGSRGEESFLSHHPDLVRLDGRKGDFVGKTGRKIELKCESRTTEETPNFFIEKYSSVESQSLGGPWQSVQHGTYYIVYMFSDGIVYWMELEPLVAFLDKTFATYKKVFIKNKGWSAMGILVPRAKIEHLIVKKENLNERI